MKQVIFIFIFLFKINNFYFLEKISKPNYNHSMFEQEKKLSATKLSAVEDAFNDILSSQGFYSSSKLANRSLADLKREEESKNMDPIEIKVKFNYLLFIFFNLLFYFRFVIGLKEKKKIFVHYLVHYQMYYGKILVIVGCNHHCLIFLHIQE